MHIGPLLAREDVFRNQHIIMKVYTKHKYGIHVIGYGTVGMRAPFDGNKDFTCDLLMYGRKTGAHTPTPFHLYTNHHLYTIHSFTPPAAPLLF